MYWRMLIILQYIRSVLSYHLSLSIFEWPLKTGFTCYLCTVCPWLIRFIRCKAKMYTFTSFTDSRIFLLDIFILGLKREFKLTYGDKQASQLCIISRLDDKSVLTQDRPNGLEWNKFVRLNTWTEPVPIQSGPPQHLGPGPIELYCSNLGAA